MGKNGRALRAKRSLSRLPKGLPVRGNATVNPFEQGPQKRPKHYHAAGGGAVVRPGPPAQTQASALALALLQRQRQVQAARQASKKANVFHDKRLTAATPEEQALLRLVKERHRVSKRVTKFQLQDDAETLTHKGKALSNLSAADHVILSDNEEDYGDLEQLDTDLHFGGGGQAAVVNPYAPNAAGVGVGASHSLSQVYAHRKTELDDLILRRKILKAERLQSKEEQVETFEKMDEAYRELAPLLQFRDKRKEYKVDPDDEMAEWDREMKTMQLNRKVAATDRTKTVEEIAAEQAERLHQLETKRLARMNGDFDQDDLSDVSIEKKQPAKSVDHPEALDYDDGDDDDEKDGSSEFTMKFTADGLVKVDKRGNIVEEPVVKQAVPSVIYQVGTRVRANYHALEQLEGCSAWYDGVISHVRQEDDGVVTYDIEYDDGDFEEGVEPQHVQVLDRKSSKKEAKPQEEDKTLKLKRQKAKEQARSSIPYVFEVPTTLDALHEMIVTHAKTGEDASLIIRRIHIANSVKLDRRNTEKMQNFYDVLLRRFIAVGDATYQSGDGGAELGRYKQLDSLTQVMYLMTQDNGESAAAVWSRRLGVFQNAHAKRLRDAELESDEGEAATAWPSTGVFLTLRALGHMFPVTDQRHSVVTPALLLIGQMVSHTPIQSIYDLVLGLLCTGLLIEYNKESKRVVPEAIAFLAGTLRLFAPEDKQRQAYLFSLPALGLAASEAPFSSFRRRISTFSGDKDELPKLSLHKQVMEKKSSCALAVLGAALDMVTSYASVLPVSSRECLADIGNALCSLQPSHKKHPLSNALLLGKLTAAVAAVDRHNGIAERTPLQRRSGPTVVSIKSLAPRLESSTTSNKRTRGDNNSNSATTALRHELQREHKAARRELSWDAALMEQARREDQAKRDQAAASKRHKAYAWLEQQQGEINNQVRQGGGLLQGGGTGAARGKARTGKLGIKKGGKL